MTRAIVVYLKSTAISHAMSMSPFLWPICEMLHFIGLALLIGGAGLMDLRLMGAFKSIPVSAVTYCPAWAPAKMPCVRSRSNRWSTDARATEGIRFCCEIARSCTPLHGVRVMAEGGT